MFFDLQTPIKYNFCILITFRILCWVSNTGGKTIEETKEFIAQILHTCFKKIKNSVRKGLPRGVAVVKVF